MRAIRVLKKAQRSLESIDSHSRQIISSIYEKQLTEGDSMLQFQKFSNKWSVGMKSTALSTSQPLLKLETPLENYLPLLSLIANSSLIESESMVILDKKVAFIVYYQRVLFVQKNRNDKKTIRSWLNQLYSLKLRKSGSLHLSNDIGKRQIIHNCEQKQYMPSLINGKQKLTRFISNIKLSSEAFYGKNGQLQKEPFCVCLFKNGDKQIFSYSQIVSFIQYPFNLQEILYFKILCQPKDEVVSLNALYSHSLETIDQRAQIQKYKRILQKTDRWAYLKDSWQQLKDKYSKQQKYQHYSELLTLQIVAFLEFKHMIKVKKLALQWKMDSKNNFILSNCHQYESFQQKNDLPINQELFFLYQQRVSRSLVSQRHQKESTQQSRKNSSCMAEITKDINQSKNMRIKIKSRKIVHRPSTLSLDKSSNISLISTKRRKIWV